MSQSVGEGFGGQLFGGGFGDPSPAPQSSNEEDELSSGDPSSASEDEDEDPSAHGEDVQTLAAKLQQTSLDPVKLENDWKDAPSYPALYLDTVSEYIPPPSKNVPKVNTAPQEGWGVEGYERTKGIDDIFEKFVLRVGQEPEQCIR